MWRLLRQIKTRLKVALGSYYVLHSEKDELGQIELKSAFNQFNRSIYYSSVFCVVVVRQATTSHAPSSLMRCCGDGDSERNLERLIWWLVVRVCGRISES